MSFVREPGSEPIPGYKLIEPLGSGGYGEVWKCVAPGELFKAIKFVYGNLNSLDAEGVRAEQELHALQRIKEVRHPFVLTNERIEIVEGELVIVMELADKSLYDAYQEAQGAGLVGIPRDDLLRYIRDAAEALDHMIEKHNLLHLDIKPRNLFLISDRVKVADFGLVKHLERTSASGMLSGVTPLYAPPETINNKISPFSDQYSLAIVYQELLTGQRPFTGKNARQLAMQHLHEQPELRALPEAERPVVARALAKEPDKRWPSCLAFVRALYNAHAAPTLVPSGTQAVGKARMSVADTMESFQLAQPTTGDEEEVAHDLPPPGENDEASAVSALGLTVAQPQTGAMRPTLVIGVGHFGRRALLELRCRFTDRFGDMNKLPLVRLLYVDADADAIRNASRGAPEMALSRASVCHLPLQPIANYRRKSLDHLGEWLPREKLYSMPRSLQTQGSRALGRLAFADNHLRLMSRLRREVQQATHPDSLYQSVSLTGLALRTQTPRIYVIAAAGGGSGGMLIDLGYSLRTLLTQLRHPDAEVIALLLCGAPSDPATPLPEQANIYACLTELHHFDDPVVPFVAQYGPDEPQTRDQGKPFGSIYLVQMAHRTPEALADAVGHVGNYVFHDLTTALGARLDKCRHSRKAEGETPFRSFGTFSVWFPRGLMLRLAARQACALLLQRWEAADGYVDTDTIGDVCKEAVADAELDYENVLNRIDDTAQLPNEGKPGESLTGFLWQLEEQSMQPFAQDTPGQWAQEAVTRLQEWVGAAFVSAQDSSWRQSRLARALNGAVQLLSKEWDERLSKIAFAQTEHGGNRLSAAEVAIQHLMAACRRRAQQAQAEFVALPAKTAEMCDQLNASLDACINTGGLSYLLGRSRRQLRTFVDQLAAFGRQYLIEALGHAGVQFYLNLAGRLEERLRELSFCRQRLRNLRECFETPEEELSLGDTHYPVDVTPSASPPPPSAEAYWDNLRGSSTVRLVLPNGESDLLSAATQFINDLTEEEWERLDQSLQERVLAPMGGLHHLCVTSADLLRSAAGPLTSETAAILGELLPVTDVAEVEMSAAEAKGQEIAARGCKHFDKAAPLVADQDGTNQTAFLLLPVSEAGKTLGEETRGALASLHLLRVPGQSDLMFCREQGNLRPEDIQRLLGPFRAAYEQLSRGPNTSPHARFDIADWVPLDPE
jgi:eukaryotic-like serine/threonine-protein kinase